MNELIKPYTEKDIDKLRGTTRIEYSISKKTSNQLRKLFEQKKFIRALSAISGSQAVQQVDCNLEAIYVSGWQVAAENNTSLSVYPDLSLYPSNSVPELVKKINNALLRAEQIANLNGRKKDCIIPIIADAESGFGGILNTFETTKSLIEAGAAAIHLEDQYPSAKKCGHMSGKVLVPVQEFINKLVSARLASDIMNVPLFIIARTDAYDAKYVTTNISDLKYLMEERTPEGYYFLKNGIDLAIDRSIAYAPYADALWFETATPDLEDAKKFAEAIHKIYPNKILFYNCSPSFNWKTKLSDKDISEFQERLGDLGYKFQFVTLSGFHSVNSAMFELARDYANNGMPAYVQLQEKEKDQEKKGYRTLRHQSFVGTEYFDCILQLCSNGTSSTTALKDSTENRQFR